jgi:glycerol-3-phosphate acyltransferase PlsY
VDLRKRGSGNPGATNCAREVGLRWGVLAFFLDVAKGFGPVFAAVHYLPRMAEAGTPTVGSLALVIVAIAPILGHVFPVWLRFRGGKAVATSLGVIFALPALRWIGLTAFGVWLLVIALLAGKDERVAIGSTTAALAFGAAYLWFEHDGAWGPDLPVTCFVLAVVAMVLVRHRSNFRRLLGRARDAAEALSGEEVAEDLAEDTGEGRQVVDVEQGVAAEEVPESDGT